MLIRGSIELAEGAQPPLSTFSYNDWGDRVVQVVRLPLEGDRSLSLLHTHLTFPHQNEHDPPMRKRQASKLAELIRDLDADGPLLCFGDMNGDVLDEAVSVLYRLGGLQPMPAKDTPWVSHVAHTGAPMACDILFSRGPCRVTNWALGYTEEALLAGTLLSDHRPLNAEVVLTEAGDPAADDEAMTMT